MYAKLTMLVIGGLFTIISQAGINGVNSNVGHLTANAFNKSVYNERKQFSFYDSLYSNRLNSLPTEIDLKYNKVVRRYIDQYTKKGKQQIGEWLGESKYYFPLFEEVLDKAGIPIELKYLPVIESALNPTARSKAGATGLWQFMHRTGTSYGLEINSLVDERRDPVKSTYAAVKYLKELYYIYQDWYLVIAAYNCGPANVNKAIYRSGGKTDYWDIYEYLPKETRNYVPAFIAATYVMSYHNEHEIISNASSYPLAMDSIKISKRLHFSHISKALNVPMEEIRRYNPQYRKDIIPGGKKYTLNLPTHKILAFVSDEDAVYSGRKVEGGIALPEILAQNTKLQENTNEGVYFSDEINPEMEAREVTTYYKIVKRDNLSSIARKNNVTVAEIKKWNNLKSNYLRAGTHLKIQKIEYYAIEPKLKEPELLVVYVDTESKKDMLSNYLFQINEEVNIQNLHAYNRTSNDMRIKAIVNNIEYRTNQYLLPVKKKNILDQFIYLANTTYASVKDWGESQLDKIKKTKHQSNETFFAENKTVAFDLVADNQPAQKENEIPHLSEVQHLTTVYNNQTYSIASNEDKEDILLYKKDVFDNNKSKKVYHKVKIGETITKIALQYKVSKDDIILWNNLTTGMAKINQQLLIYLPENHELAEYPL